MGRFGLRLAATLMLLGLMVQTARSEPASLDFEAFIASQPPPEPPRGLSEEPLQPGEYSPPKDPMRIPQTGRGEDRSHEQSHLNDVSPDSSVSGPPMDEGERSDSMIAGAGHPDDAQCDCHAGGGCSCESCHDGCPCGCSGCGGCCDRGCESCCEGCGPQWYVQAGAIFLWRNNRALGRPLAFTSPNDAVLLDTRTTPFEAGAGPRIVLGVDVDPCNTWEFQYFSAIGAEASVIGLGESIHAPGELGQQSDDWSDANAMVSDYTSDLHNVEINYLHAWGQWSLLGGIRFVRLAEQLKLNVIDFPDVDSVYRTHTRNDLYGFQIGGRYRDCRGRWYWEFTGKAGIYGNSARQSQFLTDDDGDTLLRDTRNQRNVSAFVGDLDFALGYRVNDVWSVRFGYDLLWLQSVALAGSQLDFNLGQGTGLALNTHGGVFMDGVDIGAEARW